MLKVGDNPVQRWPDNKSLSDDLGDWWVVSVKSRNEKSFARDMQRLGVGYYLPLITKRTRRRDNGKVRKSIICLFPGYVSVVDYPGFRSEIWQTGRVARVIEVKNQERFIREMSQIYRLIDEGVDLQIHDHLAIGQKVGISSGSLEGLEGIIKNIEDENRVFLNVDLFGRSISIQADPSFLISLD